MSWDYALAPGVVEGLVAHAVDCPAVRAQAALGVPVLTVLECERRLGPSTPRHDCLDEDDRPSGSG